MFVGMLEPNLKSWLTIIMDYSGGGRHREVLCQFVQNIQFSFACRHHHQVFACVLKSCAALSSSKLGRALHSALVKIGHLSCHLMSKSLLNMYAKCGDVDDCRMLFAQMGSNDPVVWNILLSGFAGSELNYVEMMRLFRVMHASHETKPNAVTFAIILPGCAQFGNSNLGKSMHTYLVKSGLETHTLVGNALVSMYAKCRLVKDDAYAAFSSIADKDVVSWNAIIAGFSENKLMYDAFRQFRWMLKGPVRPNYATIANILPVCASLDRSSAYCFGREIHCYIWRRIELGADVFVGNALVSFYLRVGRMEEAALLFQKMNSRDLISWNAIISGYASNNEWLKALHLFHELISAEKFGPDSVTFVCILPVCAQLKALHFGKQIHSYIIRRPSLCEDTTVGNALVNFYAKCGEIEAAYWTFLVIFGKDLISWNSVLDAFAEGQYYDKFLDTLHWMLKEAIIPDSITILTIIHFCVNTLREEKVRETHCYSIRTSLLLNDTEPTVGNALLDAYAKCGNMDYAFKIFLSLSEKRNLVTFNSMISGYVSRGHHCDAQLIFNKMSETDLTTWNLMIRVYAENCCLEEALGLFHKLQAQGMKPDEVTIMSLLPVCAQTASVHLLRQCHSYVTRCGYDDVHLKGALLDVYAKCGKLGSALELFKLHTHKDLVVFTAMIGAYAIHGMGNEALMVFSQMLELGVKPDHVIITAILSACSHTGLIDEGLKIFYSIEKVHRMKPTMEQYSCVVDLLARGGRIHEAYSLVNGMPTEANANVWGTLLGACRIHHEVDLGRVVADHLFEVEANNIGNYVVMSNLYAADSRWDRVVEMRKLMRTRDLKKPAGCSWIEVQRRKNFFIAGDSSHPQRDNIYSALSILDQQLKEPLLFE